MAAFGKEVPEYAIYLLIGETWMPELFLTKTTIALQKTTNRVA